MFYQQFISLNIKRAPRIFLMGVTYTLKEQVCSFGVLLHLALCLAQVVAIAWSTFTRLQLMHLLCPAHKKADQA